MNCKQGDLALVIAAKDQQDKVGRIVTCEMLVPRDFVLRNQIATQKEGNWIVFDGRMRWIHGDERLRPIRDNDGQDETLTWQPVPAKEAA